MTKFAIIGGTGFDEIDALSIDHRFVVRTPYGDPSGVLLKGSLFDKQYYFLPRHGRHHHIPPHGINYRANIWALKQKGVKKIIAIAAVGGIHTHLSPGSIVIPEQLIDYTWGREHTYFDGKSEGVTHIEFTNPYDEKLRKKLLTAAKAANVQFFNTGVYAATQGPRLETAAEINRLENDGATIVGMTGMPEAALAKELDISYACIAIVVNPAAGRSKEPITMDMIKFYLKQGSQNVLEILKNF